MENPGRDIHNNLINWRRRQNSLLCPDCQKPFASQETLKRHLLDQHHDPADLTAKTRIAAALRAQANTTKATAPNSKRPAASEVLPRDADDSDNGSASPNKRIKSPGPEQPPIGRTPPPVTRSRGRPPPASGGAPQQPEDAPAGDFPTRRDTKGRGVYNPDQHAFKVPTGGPSPRLQQPSQQSPKASSAPRPSTSSSTQSRPFVASTADDPPQPDLALIREPETRPISQEQLVAEVKGIYAGLVMVENKCMEVDSGKNSIDQAAHTLNNEQWQALIALHRTLLHEHHDFFLASQHPSALPSLRRLATKYAMPARMWRHGIHSFLEVLRHRLPHSLEHMLTFIYLAYSMMALLYETVPAFEDTWIECLGDLGRYRMAIEDDDLRDREVWTGVSRHWYSRASDKSPKVGRLYHHLAILARPNAVVQLFFYMKSLCVETPFVSARESVLTLFDPILSGSPTKSQPVELSFVKTHGILFTSKYSEDLDSARTEFLEPLDAHIARSAKKFLETGHCVAIVNCSALLEYGANDSLLVGILKDKGGEEQTNDQSKPQEPTKEQESADEPMDGSASTEAVAATSPPQSAVLQAAIEFASQTDRIILRRTGDSNCFSYLHSRMLWLRTMSGYPQACSIALDTFPWKPLTRSLNYFINGYTAYSRIELGSPFPRPEKGDHRPLVEDWALRGLLWADNYFPEDWFTTDKLDDEEKLFEIASMTEERRERCLWLAVQLAASGRWIVYEDHRFSVTKDFDIEDDAELDLIGTASPAGVSGEDEVMASPPVLSE